MKKIDPPIVTLLTDFGWEDFYVAGMKAVILSRSQRAVLVDITHSVAPQDLQSAAFTLEQCFAEFPPGTIHVAVVDPGVGSGRKPILIETEKFYFVGPDNGIFSLACDKSSVQRVIELSNDQYFRKPVSHTFHGRDIFAAVAGHLAAGIDPQKFGSQLEDFERLEVRKAQRVSASQVRGEVVHIDRFGNLITNVFADDLPIESSKSGITISIRNLTIRSLRTHFEPGKLDELCAVVGSTGRIEIAVTNGSARQSLNAAVGTTVEVSFPKPLRLVE